MSEYKNCSSEAALSGLGNTNIACSYLFRNASFSKLLIGNTEIKLSFKSAPEFVWIKTDVEGKRLFSAGIWLLYNVASTSIQRH